MKRSIALLIGAALVLATLGFSGCIFDKESGTEDQPKANSIANIGKGKLFQPDELLSPADAARLAGTAKVSIDPGTLKVENGESYTRYTYDLSDSTTLHALFQLRQDAGLPKADLASNSAIKWYESMYNRVKNESDVLTGIGDKAFLFKPQGQVYVLYGGYFFMLAFESSDETKTPGINIAIAKHIVANIKSKQ
jgi:hypothetical protein